MGRGNAVGTLIAVIACGGCAAGGTTWSPRDATTATTSSSVVRAKESPCRAVGPAQVVATRAFVPAGVTASIEGGQASVRFNHRASRCAVTTILTDSGHTVARELPAACPDKPDPITTNGDKASIARDGQDQAGMTRGKLGSDGRAGALAIDADGYRGGSRRPGLAPLSTQHVLMAWSDGDVESHVARAQVTTAWGEPVGPAIDLSPADVSVIGRPSPAIGDDGKGIVAFLGSNGDGFDVLVTPIVCELP